MHLHHIDIAKLTVSPANMRGRGKKADITDILPSVRARGVLVPLLVRQNGSPDTFEIVAGRRRFEAARAVAEEGGTSGPLPCAVIEAGDDAAALEASLIENLARLDPDEAQAGHVRLIGAELYQHLLERAVAEARGAPLPLDLSPRLALGDQGWLPSDYVPEELLRIALYRRLARLRPEEDVAELQAEIADRFGPPPASVCRLLAVAALRRTCRRLGVTRSGWTILRRSLQHLRDIYPRSSHSAGREARSLTEIRKPAWLTPVL